MLPSHIYVTGITNKQKNLKKTLKKAFQGVGVVPGFSSLGLVLAMVRAQVMEVWQHKHKVKGCGSGFDEVKSIRVELQTVIHCQHQTKDVATWYNTYPLKSLLLIKLPN